VAILRKRIKHTVLVKSLQLCRSYTGCCGGNEQYFGGIFYRIYYIAITTNEGKRPFGRPRRRYEDKFKMDIQEVGGGYGDWMELAQDRDRWRALVSTVRNLRVPEMRGIS
jgi:hypothetical protein